MKEIGSWRRMSLDIGRGCACLGGQCEDLFLLASGIGVRGNNPDSFDQKEWRHLEKEKKEVKDFTFKYVSEKKDLSPGHISNTRTGGNLPSSQRTQSPRTSF